MKGSLFDLIRVLAEADIPFVLVGGLAANLHGSSIATFDCDVLMPMDETVLVKLAEALAPFAPSFRPPAPPIAFSAEEAKSRSLKSVYLKTDAGILDCLGEIRGLGCYESVVDNSVLVPGNRFSFRVLSREQTIRAKEAMGRPKDLETVKQLRLADELDKS